MEKPYSYRFLESPDDTLVYQKYVEMTTLLNQFEDHIYNEWKSNVNEICEFNLNQPLVKFSATSGLLSVNFDPKVGFNVFKMFYKCPFYYKCMPNTSSHL